jgi:hypothetical protein
VCGSWRRLHADCPAEAVQLTPRGLPRQSPRYRLHAPECWRPRPVYRPESPLAPPCAGGTSRLDRASSRPKPGHRVATADAAHPLPPAVANQALGALRHFVFVRPGGRPSHGPLHTSTEVAACRVAARIGVDWSMPSEEQALRSPSHRSTTYRLLARSTADPTRPSVCPGFPVRAPSLHRCLSIDTLPKGVPVAFGPAANTPRSAANSGRDERRSTPGLCSTDESVV